MSQAHCPLGLGNSTRTGVHGCRGTAGLGLSGATRAAPSQKVPTSTAAHGTSMSRRAGGSQHGTPRHRDEQKSWKRL